MESVDSVERGEGEREDAGPRPEDEPGSGVVTAFGRQLKLLRVRAGLERAGVRALMGYAAQSIASFEQGRRIPPPRFIDRADEVLDAGGVLKALKEEVARAQYPAFFRDMARLEARRSALSVYDASCGPGPVADGGVRAGRLPDAGARCWTTRSSSSGWPPVWRGRRSSLVARALLSFVIEEAVLRKPLGGQACSAGSWSRSCSCGRTATWRFR